MVLSFMVVSGDGDNEFLLNSEPVFFLSKITTEIQFQVFGLFIIIYKAYSQKLPM